MKNVRMKLPLRRIIAASCLMSVCAMLDTAAAQQFPAKRITIVVNTGPGGLVDVTTRIVAQKMSENLGQPVVIENRAGGDGTIGIVAVKNAAPDGYTLLTTANTISIQPAVKINPGYNTKKDFLGIGPIVRSPLMFMVGANQPDKSLAEFIKRAKSDPASISYASGGTGTTTHLGAALFLKQAGLDLLHVPYKGNGPAMPDVISGRVSMIFEAYGSGVGKLKTGTLRTLGVTSTSRLPSLPDVPTIAEQGVPGFSFYLDIGLLAPAGTPPAVIERLAAALRSALTSKDIVDRFRESGDETVVMSPVEFDAFLEQDLVRMSKLSADLKIEKQ